MAWQYTPTFWLPVGISLVSARLAWLGWRRRHLVSHRNGMAAAIATFLWAWAYALQLASVEVGQAYLWMAVATVVPAGLPVFWFVVAYHLCYPRSRLHIGTGIVLAIVPTISIWLLAFPGLGGPMADSARMLDVDGIQVLQVLPGPWFRIHLAYIFALISLTVAMLFVRARHLSPPPRRKAMITLAALVVLLAGNALHVTGWIQWHRFHPSTLTSLLTQLVFLWGILDTPILDVRPIARDRVIEAMRDGLIVLDAEQRIVDFTPAAGYLLGTRPDRMLGESAAAALSPWPDLAGLCANADAQSAIVRLPENSDQAEGQWIETHRQPIHNRRGQPVGCIMTLRDITLRKRAEVEREQLVAELRGALAEVKTLQGLLPVCAWCGKIHDDDGSWATLDDYVQAHYDASVTHGICPECATRFARDGDALARGTS